MGCGTFSKSGVEHIQISAFLSVRQIDLVKHSWELIKDEMAATGLLVYTSFLHSEIDLRRFFPNILNDTNWDVNEEVLQRHAMAVMQGLGAAVESIEDTSILHSLLLDVGEKHHSMRIKPQYLERLWPAIDFGFKEVLQDVYTRELKDAWRQIFMYIIAKMKEGMQRARHAEKQMSKSGVSEESEICSKPVSPVK